MRIPYHDVIVIGAGLVGLAAAYRLTERRPGIDLLVVDKEQGVGAHQSGHNSGVVHSGLYYEPGSLRARLCRTGRRQLDAFAYDHHVEIRRLGKLVVAVSDAELRRLDTLMARGIANGLTGLERLGPSGIRDHVPSVGGIAGLWVPETAITHYGEIARAMQHDLVHRGVQFQLGSEVSAVQERTDGAVVILGDIEVRGRKLVSCAGLQSDLLARMAGHRPRLRIFPFRGDYFDLAPDTAARVACLIYPVPDPRLPFLGVHLTPDLTGRVTAGPNAVLAFHREGYRRRDVSLRQLTSMLTSSEFWRLARRYSATGMTELWRDLSVRSYARTVAAYLPGVGPSDLRPGGSGVRAQAVGRDGSLIDDFVLLTSETAVHVLNAPSPAATACLAIGEIIADAVYPMQA